MIGTYVLSAGYYDAYYLKAQKVRRRDRRRLRRRRSRRCDAHPDADRALGRLPGRRQAGRPGRHVPERHLHRDRRTWPACPGITVPAGLDGRACRSACRSIGRPWTRGRSSRVGAAHRDAAGFGVLPYGLADAA